MNPIFSPIEDGSSSVPQDWLKKAPDYLENELGFNLSSVDLGRLAQEVQLFNDQPFNNFEHFASQLSSRIAVHETYFLRHHEQFEWLENIWAKEIVRSSLLNGDVVNILSAGCSTGEEPYSVYAHLVPFFERYGIRVHIDAIDVAPSVLDIARQGCYGLWSLRGVNIEQERWLQLRSRTVEVKDWVKNGVNFRQHNLIRPFNTVNRYDLILCRNVMIYMHPEAVRSIYSNLAGLLKTTGFIMPGPSDPAAMAVEGLQLRWSHNVRLYTGEHNSLCSDHPVVHKPVAVQEKKPLNEPEIKQEKNKESAIHYDYAQISDLISACRYDDARQYLENNIDKNPLDIKSYVMLSMLAMDLDDYVLAQLMAQKALFLTPDALYIVYLTEQIKRRKSDKKITSNQWLWLQKQLSEKDDDEILMYSDNVSVGLLKGVMNAGK